MGLQKSVMEDRVALLEEKIAALSAITANASAKADTDLLVSTMRELTAHREDLVCMRRAYTDLRAENETLRKRVEVLEDTVEKRDYRILHLSRNLKELLDKTPVE